MSSIGMRRTSLIEWPAWLKCSDTGVVVLSCWWFRIERRCSPKRSLSWRLVSPMYWRWHFLHSIRYMRFFEWQDMESVIFLASLVVKKYSLFDPLVEKNKWDRYLIECKKCHLQWTGKKHCHACLFRTLWAQMFWKRFPTRYFAKHFEQTSPFQLCCNTQDLRSSASAEERELHAKR